MASTDQLPPRLAFGAFEVVAGAGELLKGGIRVRLAAQPWQILLMLLAHHGELVTREQLREQIWSEGTFVDFEHGLNTAINKLRRALGDSADNPRYIETVPGRGYRFVGTLKPRFDPPPTLATSVVVENISRTHGAPIWLKFTFGIACLIAAFALGWRFHSPAVTPQPLWRLIRLTADGGLSDAPAVSPDGKLVAYSSDGGLSGQRDLYIRQIGGGGQTIRLTFDGAENTTPDFSPDGNRIVFRSNRDGGGIYEVPAFGGDIRLVARGGLNPRFSPDGSQVAYWIGTESVAAAIPGTGQVWIVPVGGGGPQRVGQSLTSARYPIWSRDGKHLLVVGYRSARTFDSSSIDWWLVPTDGGEAIQTGAHEVMARAGMQLQLHWRTPVPRVPSPSCWSEADNTVVFSTPTGDAENLWQMTLSPQTGKVIGLPKRLTTGSGNHVNPSCSHSGALAFASVDTRSDLWLLPFDLKTERPQGMLERITGQPAWRESVSLARTGRYLAFASYQSGLQNIWLRDFETGKEMSVARSSFAQRFPVINASGTKIAFSVYEKDKRIVYVSSPGGAPEKLCEGCAQATDWSHDEKKLLMFGGYPYKINILEIASHRQIPLIQHPEYAVLYGKFSPDNRWVSFTARVQSGRGRITVAPIDGTKPVAQSAWVTIAETGADDFANWSPDGNTLYFTSERDGYSCLWGQRIDSLSRRPVGGVFPVQHLHGRLIFNHGGWTAANDRFVISLVERAGNIWMLLPSVAP